MSACRTTLRAVSEHFGLALKVHHRFTKLDGVQWHQDPASNGRIPPEADVYAAQTITLTLTGLLNGKLVSLESLASSQIARHLFDYLQTNSGELGLEAVGEPSLVDSEALRLQISPQYASRNPRTSKPHFKLCGIDLAFCWTGEGLDEDPFAEHCPLPYMSLLSQVIHRLVIFQFVRRYPLIFGSWCKQLATEETFIKSVEKSIRSIAKRSKKEGFQSHVHSLFQSLTRNARLEYRDAAELVHTRPPKKLKDEAFTYSMEKVYRLGQKRKGFKGVSRVAGGQGKDEYTLHEEEALQKDSDASILDDIFAVPSLIDEDDIELDGTPDYALSSYCSDKGSSDAYDPFDPSGNSQDPVGKYENSEQCQILDEDSEDEYRSSISSPLDDTFDDTYDWDAPRDYTSDVESVITPPSTKPYDQGTHTPGVFRTHDQALDNPQMRGSGGLAKCGRPSSANLLDDILDFDDPLDAQLDYPQYSNQTPSTPIEDDVFLSSDNEDFDFEAADLAKASESCEGGLPLFPPADLSQPGACQDMNSAFEDDEGAGWSSDEGADPTPSRTYHRRDAQRSRQQHNSPDQRVTWTLGGHHLPREFEQELDLECDERLVSVQPELGDFEDLVMGFDE